MIFAASISAEWRWPYAKVSACTARPSLFAIARTVVESRPPLRSTTAVGSAPWGVFGDCGFTGSGSPVKVIRGLLLERRFEGLEQLLGNERLGEDRGRPKRTHSLLPGGVDAAAEDDHRDSGGSRRHL